MFLSMQNILLKNNLISVKRENEYYTIRNRAKIIYSILTMIAALISGYLYNINNYIPMYLSIIIYSIIVVCSFLFYEEEKDIKIENKQKARKHKINFSSVIFIVIVSNMIFRSLILIGQGNSKIFMQYDFENYLSIEMVTYYISVIVFISRISRIVGNITFGKIYLRIKDKISILLALLLSLAFALLILGHLLVIPFIYKATIMALGFFLILATRDSFQVYIEDIALNITDTDEQQKIMVDIEVYRKIGTLILSTCVTLILLKFEIIFVIGVLFVLSIIEILINQKLFLTIQGENYAKINK